VQQGFYQFQENALFTSKVLIFMLMVLPFCCTKFRC